MSEEKKLPGGYRLIIIDVDEDKIIEDQIVSAFMGAFAQIKDKDLGIVGVHEVMACSSSERYLLSVLTVTSSATCLVRIYGSRKGWRRMACKDCKNFMQGGGRSGTCIKKPYCRAKNGQLYKKSDGTPINFIVFWGTPACKKHFERKENENNG